MNAVSLEGVCKSFGQVRAVDNLDVNVPTGSIYGFLGAMSHFNFRFDPNVKGPSNRCEATELSEVNPVASNAFTVASLIRSIGALKDSILPASTSITFFAFCNSVTCSS